MHRCLRSWTVSKTF